MDVVLPEASISFKLQDGVHVTAIPSRRHGEPFRHEVPGQG
jgi:hypothetical protein